MYQSQYSASNIIGGVVRLVISWGKYLFEGCHSTLRFDLVVAIGLDQFICRGWIVLGFECFIEATKSPTSVAAHRSGLVGPVTDLLLLPLRLLWLLVVFVLVSVSFVV